jgi:hypothetical protein
MGRALQRGRGGGALRGVGEIERDELRAAEIAWLASRQRDDVTTTNAAEVPQSGTADQPGRAGDHHFLACHSRTRHGAGTLSRSDVAVLRQVAARAVAATGGRWRILHAVRICGKHRALIPFDGLSILFRPEDTRASTSAAGETKNDNQEPCPSSSYRHNRGETHETS